MDETDDIRGVVATPDDDQPTAIHTVPAPEPAPGEAVIAVEAFAVNRGELTLLRTRERGWRPGQDVAGTVVAAATDGTGPAEGERVAGLADWHGWAERVAVPADRLVPIPVGVTTEQAAALPMAGTTAWGVLEKAGGGLLGRRVLVSGASGGVGHIAVQLAAIGGAEVTAVARTASAEHLRELGASAVVEEIGQAGAGFDVVLESAGGASLGTAVDAVGDGGTIVTFGDSLATPTEIAFERFAGREAVIASYFSTLHEHRVGDRLGRLLGLMAGGRLTVDVGRTAPWTALNDVIAALAARELRGKAVLTVA